LRRHEHGAGGTHPDVHTYNSMMAGHECYHCKQWVEAGEPHDCWTTTEAALTRELSEDLREAWERLRESAAALGDQRIYASHKSIMFSRRTCYCFVRPKRSFLELTVFLGRTVKAPQVRRAVAASSAKVAHVVPITHRDQVEPPVTDWLREAYDWSEAKGAKPAARRTAARKTVTRKPKSPGAKKRVAKPTSTAKRPRPNTAPRRSPAAVARTKRR
jgi:hypothetical protein